jgi:phage terminase large subunit
VLGFTGKSEGLIYKDWDIVEEIPAGARFLGHGMDFGYTADPSVWVDLYLMNDEVYTNYQFYKRGLKSKDIADLMTGREQGTTWADSAEPRMIDELRGYNLNVRGVTKGQGSINYGIDLLQERKIHITSSSIDAIEELRQYKWDSRKDGTMDNKPIDAFNHFCDALRYAAMETLQSRRVRSTGRRFSVVVR